MVTLEQELLAAHAAYLDAWNRALQTGDWESAACFLGEGLRSWFFNPGMEAPSTGDRQSYADSIRDAVGYLGSQARWSFDNPLVAMRGKDFGVLAGRVWLHRPGRAPHPMLILAAWRQEDGEWRQHRIYEEVGVPEGPPADGLLAVDAEAVRTWDACLRSGDPEPALAVQSPALQAVFGNRNLDEPKQMDAAAYREGCSEVVTSRHCTGWRTVGRIGEMRSPDEGVVVAHCLARTDNGEHSVLSLAVWRRVAGDWSLVRIYEEG